MADTAKHPIVVKGSYFWRGNDRFLIRGVAYHPRDTDGRGYVDPISDDRLPRLKHDIALFEELGVNAIYILAIDNTKTHDQAMKMLEEAGIYVLAAIATPTHSIDRRVPYDSYTSENLKVWFRNVDVLASYPNTLGIFAAHAIVNNSETIVCAPVIAAVVRDIKTYMQRKNEATGQRILPVGYAAATTTPPDRQVLNYLSAGDHNERIDFWACDGYQWAGPSNMQMSAYDRLVENLKDKKLPIFFSGYGANVAKVRPFDETRALFSSEMTHVFSGGFAYEFWNTCSCHGLLREITSEDEAKLVERFPEENPEDRLQHLSSSDKVVESRQTDWGTIVHIFEDFVNYKASLEAMKDVPPVTDRTRIQDHKVVERTSTLLEVPHYPEWAVGVGPMPDSCVDWVEIMKDDAPGLNELSLTAT